MGYGMPQHATEFADMAELADAPDLGSGGRPCRFESCYPHLAETAVNPWIPLWIQGLRLFLCGFLLAWFMPY